MGDLVKADFGWAASCRAEAQALGVNPAIVHKRRRGEDLPPYVPTTALARLALHVGAWLAAEHDLRAAARQQGHRFQGGRDDSEASKSSSAEPTSLAGPAATVPPYASNAGARSCRCMCGSWHNLYRVRAVPTEIK